jgi:CheY-like chemotaxis protein
LVVEDERMLRDLIVMDLQEEGVRVEVASDGDEAIEIMRTKAPDLVLLDLLMPKKDGYAVLEFIREGGYSFPTVVLSNLSSPDQREKCKGLGARDFIVKSDLNTGDLWEKVKGYLA